jgi:D-glycero-alpha-D-manno-heptose 1-phosphate guanylyltransferase
MEMLILAGGFGKRLKNTIINLPKPMAPINGVPLLQLQLDHWIMQGQTSFIFLLHHQADIIIELLIERSSYFGSKINIDWVVEDTPMGTGGAVANAIRLYSLSGSILVTNADTWLDNGLKKIINNNSLAVIAVVKVIDTRRYGSVSINSKNRVLSFVEKQMSSNNPVSGVINAGLYKLPVSVFSGLGEVTFSLETEILPSISADSLLSAETLEVDFFDIGVPEDYYKFCEWHKGRK